MELVEETAVDKIADLRNRFLEFAEDLTDDELGRLLRDVNRAIEVRKFWKSEQAKVDIGDMIINRLNRAHEDLAFVDGLFEELERLAKDHPFLEQQSGIGTCFMELREAIRELEKTMSV